MPAIRTSTLSENRYKVSAEPKTESLDICTGKQDKKNTDFAFVVKLIQK